MALRRPGLVRWLLASGLLLLALGSRWPGALGRQLPVRVLLVMALVAVVAAILSAARGAGLVALGAIAGSFALALAAQAPRPVVLLAAAVVLAISARRASVGTP